MSQRRAPGSKRRIRRRAGCHHWPRGLQWFERLEARTPLAVLNFLGPVSVTEGETLEFQIQLQDNGVPVQAAQSFEFHLRTVDSSAIGGPDFLPIDDTFNFPAGATSITVEVPTIDDPNLIEGTESFQLQMSGISGIAGVTAGFPTLGLIQDNEPVAVVSVEGPSVVDESAGTVVYELVMVVPAGFQVEAVSSYFVSPLDSGTAEQFVDFLIPSPIFGDFPAGVTGEIRIDFSYRILDDALVEGDETIDFNLFVGSLGGVEGAFDSFTVTIDDDETPNDPQLQVAAFAPTASGFVVEFNRTLDLGVLNLYDTQTGGFGPADVTLSGQSAGQVTGSLVVNSSATGIEFVKSGGPLPPDTYTVTLRSGVNAFLDVDGNLLDGNADETAGDDFSTSFVVEALENAVTIGIADFVRGPGQAVNVPANTAGGIPVVLSEGQGVRDAEFRLRYDADQIEITSASVAPGTPANSTATLSAVSPNEVLVHFESPTALPAGGSPIVMLQANVPAANAASIYGTQGVLELHTAAISNGLGGSIPAIEDIALHHVSFFGDVSGNGRINGSDAALVARVGALLDGGFESVLLTDPNLIGDISGNGRINASDASKVAQFAALLPVPEIPAIPGGVVLASGAGSRHADDTELREVAFLQTPQMFASSSLASQHDADPTPAADPSPPETLSEYLSAIDAALTAL